MISAKVVRMARALTEAVGSKRTLAHNPAKVGRLPVEHVVKSWPQFFEPTLLGIKTHDVRRVHDRDYRVGDRMRLREFDPTRETYTGRELLVEITYVTSAEHPCALSEMAIDPRYCILSIRKIA